MMYPKKLGQAETGERFWYRCPKYISNLAMLKPLKAMDLTMANASIPFLFQDGSSGLNVMASCCSTPSLAMPGFKLLNLDREMR